MAEYIEREATKKALAYSGLVPKFMADNRCVTDKVIDEIPAADVAPVRHGRWDYYEESLCIRAHARCSVCNRPRYEHYVFNNFLYCPSCGAKMDGGESDA